MKPAGPSAADSNRRLLSEIGDLLREPKALHEDDERLALIEGLERHAPGSVVEHFRIVRRLGEGGFAEVFEATQETPVKRRVALKVMKPGRVSSEGLARFEIERQALAMMEHPSIATVYEAGTTSLGQPYFAMELVNGPSITKFCQSQGLSLPEKIRLLIHVSQAVHHAHQKGIIHRDLKPSNILVTVSDEEPLPKVIDFGVAKAVEHVGQEENGFTREFQILGTPQYMSPEQLEGRMNQIDTRTDVHALGIIAYELVTGTTPFSVDDARSDVSYSEVLDRARSQEIKRPSLVVDSKKQGLLKGDLDWIIMKAIHPERAHRYESASAFADDLQRHLSNEQVLAGAPGLVYRARKYAKRHRVLLATTAAVCLSMLAGSIISLNQAQRAKRAEKQARENLEISRVVSGFLQNDLLGGNKGFNHRHAPTVEFKTIVDQAGEQIDKRFQSKPEIQRSLHLTMARVYTRLSEFDHAQRHLDRCLELSGDEPLSLDHLSAQAELLYVRDEIAEAYQWFERCFQHPDASERDLFAERLMYSECLAVSGQQTKAEAQMREMYLSLPSEASEYRVAAIRSLADVHDTYGRLDEAVSMLKEALLICEQNGEAMAEAARGIRLDLARYHARQHSFEEAEPLYVNYISDRYKRFGMFDREALLQSNILASFYLEFGFDDKAVRLLQDAYSRIEHREDLRFVRSAFLSTLRRHSEVTGDFKLAEEYLERRMALIKVTPFEELSYMDNARSHGDFYFRTGQPEKAIDVYQHYLQESPNDDLFRAEFERAVMLTTQRALLPYGGASDTHWQVTESRPLDGWTRPAFDDTGWDNKRVPLGSTRLYYYPYFHAHSSWFTDDVWMRKRFVLEKPLEGDPVLHLAHDDDVEVYINGVAALLDKGTTANRYTVKSIAPEAAAALVVGENVIAVHCSNKRSDQMIDVGLYESSLETAPLLAERYDRIVTDSPPSAVLRIRQAFWLTNAKRFEDANEALRVAHLLDDQFDVSSLEERSPDWKQMVQGLTINREDAKEDSIADAIWAHDRVEVLVSRGSEWAYHDQGKDLGTAWKDSFADDWSRGKAPLGYGDDFIVTPIDGGPDSENRHPTTYFQHLFEAAEAGSRTLKIRLRVDDGAAIYLNGQEVLRVNLAPDASYVDRSPVNIAKEEELRYQVYLVENATILKGTNLLAVEVHQDSPMSSDTALDLALEALIK